jgi:bifunctional DNase/RNase
MSAGADGTPWRIVTVAGVRLELPGVHPEVMLQESEAPWRQLRIPVGFAEGTAIAYAWRGVPTPRPLTHELLAGLLDRHGIDVAALRITERRGALFLAELETSGPRGAETVPCRPSDGLALVLRRRLPTPVLVAESVFDPGPGASGAQGGEPPPEVPERA